MAKKNLRKEDQECVKILATLFKLHSETQSYIKKWKSRGIVFPIILNHHLKAVIADLKKTYPDMKPLIEKARRKLLKNKKSRT